MRYLVERARLARGARRALLHEARRLHRGRQPRAVRDPALPARARGRGGGVRPGEGLRRASAWTTLRDDADRVMRTNFPDSRYLKVGGDRRRRALVAHLGSGLVSRRILVIGAAGMIGRKLTARLKKDGAGELILHDVVPFDGASAVSDLSAPGEAEKLVASRPDLIFHLAAIVSGEAEADFDKGYRINLDGTRHLFEAIRKDGEAAYKPQRRVHLLDRRLRRAVSRRDRRRVPQRAAHQLRHAEGDRRAAALRLQPARLLRRHRHPPADHLRAPGQAEQGRLRLLLRHPARAARRPGSDPAGARHGAALVRLAARGHRVPDSCCDNQHRTAGRAAQPVDAGPVAPPSPSRSRRCAASPATRR